MSYEISIYNSEGQKEHIALPYKTSDVFKLITPGYTLFSLDELTTKECLPIAERMIFNMLLIESNERPDAHIMTMVRVFLSLLIAWCKLYNGDYKIQVF